MSDTEPVPLGFEPVDRGGPFFMQMAPVYRKRLDTGVVLGLRVAPKHGNSHGNAHGGMLMTMADGAFFDNIMLQREAADRIVTANMSADFMSAARVGDWLEAHVTVHRRGKLLSFADCLIKVGDRVVLRANATFVKPPSS